MNLAIMNFINHIPFTKSPKQACLFLAGFILVCTILIFQLNLKKSYGLYAACKSYETDISRSANASADIAQYTTLLGDQTLEEGHSYDRAALLELITNYSDNHDVFVASFPQASYVDIESYPIVTSTLHLTGGYKDIISLVYQIEHIDKLSSVSGIKMETKKNRKTKKTQLHAYITLRNINNKNKGS